LYISLTQVVEQWIGNLKAAGLYPTWDICLRMLYFVVVVLVGHFWDDYLS